MAQRINAPEQSLPTFFSSEQSGRPHIEVTSQGYHWVVCERGEENSRKTTQNLRSLLYWIFDSTTFSLASKWELENRKENEDFRRQLFSKQIELMNEIDPEFAKKLKDEQENILRQYRFTDNGA